MPRRRYRPDPSTWLPRVLTRSAASERLGSPDAVDRRLARGTWCGLAPGIYCTAPPVTDHDILVAAVLHGGDDACLSGAAALCHAGFRSVPTWDTALVLVPYEQGPESVGRIQIRPTVHLPSTHDVHGIRLAAIERCVVDHALTLTRLDDVRAVVAEAVQRRRCTPESLERALAVAPRRGSKHLRQAIADVSGGARSAPEARAATTFRKVELPEWRPNHAVQIGARTYVLDFWFEQLRATVEIDGEEYHRFGASWDVTLSRDAVLQTAGIAVLHVQPSRTRSDDGLLELVVPWLRRRAADLGVTWQWH